MQKALSRLLESAAAYLEDTDNIMTVTEKHLRSKVVPEQADEACDSSTKSPLAYNPMTVLRAWHALMEEKERLGRAITAAKAALPLNLDTATEENKARRRFLRTLAQMMDQRATSRMRNGAGKGYVFNKEGNQTPYRYNIEVVRTIDYDRNVVRCMQNTLAKKAADISRAIDDALVRTEVDFALQLPIPESTISDDSTERCLADAVFGSQASALAEIIEAMEEK